MISGDIVRSRTRQMRLVRASARLRRPAHHCIRDHRILQPQDRSSCATASRSQPLPQAEGTPLYVYSAEAIRARYRAIDEAFGAYPHALHYALKANSTFGIVRLLRSLGSAADANSVWEIEVARRAGFAPADIVFTGVGKSGDELACAVPLGLKAINVESAGELARIEADCRGARHAGAGRRPHQPRHRRQEPPSHLHRPEDQQVRRAARCRTRSAGDRWPGAAF